MSESAETTLQSLSPEERLSLIHALWDSLSDEEMPLTDAQRTELERRLARFDEDKADAVTWKALKAELRRRAG
jgi:putative addiction module component (TIGR02574 family)